MKLSERISDALAEANGEGYGNPNAQYTKLVIARGLLEQRTPTESEWENHETDWAWFYNMMLNCLTDLGKQAELADTAAVVVERFQYKDDILYDYSFTTVRDVLRKSHGILSRHYLETDDIDQANAHIDTCFSIRSGFGEDEDPYLENYETRAIVYLRAFEKQIRAGEDFFQALLTLKRKSETEYEVDVSINDPDLMTWLESEDFLAYRQEDPIEKNRCAAKNESWRDAVARYETMLELLNFPEDTARSEGLFRNEPETEETLKSLEDDLGIKIPEGLRNFYLNYGAFDLRSSQTWESLQLYNSSNKYQKMIDGLQRSVDNYWGGRPEFDWNFNREEIDAFNHEFFVFGNLYHHDNAHSYLYFTRSGKFGVFHYDQDDWESVHMDLRSMLESPDKDLHSFDEMLSNCVDTVIAALIEYREKIELGLE